MCVALTAPAGYACFVGDRTVECMGTVGDRIVGCTSTADAVYGLQFILGRKSLIFVLVLVRNTPYNIYTT